MRTMETIRLGICFQAIIDFICRMTNTKMPFETKSAPEPFETQVTFKGSHTLRQMLEDPPLGDVELYFFCLQNLNHNDRN